MTGKPWSLPVSDRTTAMEIVNRLQTEGISNLQQLCHWTNVEPDQIRQHMIPWIEKGCVEELIPSLTALQAVPNDRIFYRWKESTDRDFVWQQSLCERRQGITLPEQKFEQL